MVVCHDVYLDISIGDQRDLIHHFATAFFLAHLVQNEKAAAALDASAVSIAGVEYSTAP